MFPNINPASNLFLANLQIIQNRMSTDEQQLTSGLRVNVASDAPDQISEILQTRAQISGVQQTQQNLSTVGPLVDSGESAIQQALQLLDTATTLATGAASTTTTAAQRLDSAPQVQGILEQLVSLSQTAVAGTYVFSGDQSTQPTYSVNLANGNGVNQLSQPGPPGQIADATGITFSTGLTAQQVFDDRNPDGSYAPDNVFAAVNGLLTALQTNNVPNVQQAITNIQSASAYLNNESSFYGGVQNTITAANTSASATLVTLQQQLSNLQDADATSDALDLTSVQTNEQAAMSAEAQLKPQSLFTYL
jgi:flagellar hook-associated protein 3 FlgL